MKKATENNRLLNVPMAELRDEIRRRERLHEVLKRRHVRLAERLAALEEKMRSLGAAGVNDRKRSLEHDIAYGNLGPMTVKAHELFQGRNVSIQEALAAMSASGYNTNSRSVNMLLASNPKLFRRVSRGVYTSRKP